MTENEAIKMLENILIDYKNLKNAILCQQMVDLAVKALREVQEYREMDRKLRKCFGDCDGLLKAVVDGICYRISVKEPIKLRLLTNEDADMWDAYRAIGTVEECREATRKQKKAKKVTAESEVIYNMKWKCPECGGSLTDTDVLAGHCKWCGQAIYGLEPPNGQ